MIILSAALAQAIGRKAIHPQDKQKYITFLERKAQARDLAAQKAAKIPFLAAIHRKEAAHYRAMIAELRAKGDGTPRPPSVKLAPGSGFKQRISGGGGLSPTFPELGPVPTQTFQQATASDVAAAQLAQSVAPITPAEAAVAETPMYKRPIVLIGSLVLLGALGAAVAAYASKSKKGKKSKGIGDHAASALAA